MDITQITQAVKQAVFNANMAAMKTVLANFTANHYTEDLRKQLASLPSEIYHHRKKVNNYRTQLRNILKDLKEKETAQKSLENEMLLLITSETNPNTGKPMFSNDKARQAELNNRKKTDPEYIALEKQIRGMRNQVDDLENLIAMAEAEVEHLQSRFTAVTKQINLLCKEMALVAAAMSSGSQVQQQFGTDMIGQANTAADGWDT